MNKNVNKGALPSRNHPPVRPYYLGNTNLEYVTGTESNSHRSQYAYSRPLWRKTSLRGCVIECEGG